jgi:hypothetical protein
MTPNWFSEKKEHNSIEDFPKDCFGYVYIITNLQTGRYYVGKKFLFHNTKRKIGKKEKLLMEGKGRKPSFELIHKESDWKSYWGSSKEFLAYVKEHGEENFKRTILHYAFNKRQLTYLEVKTQFGLGVLEDKLSFNDNIGGRYFKKDLVG